MAARLAVVCLAALALTASAHAATRPVAGAAPTGLRGFLLRADEPRTTVFSRTPSFAWNPVPRAVRYEFQLSTSPVFREGGILFSDEQLTTPAASVPLSLPWITGSPYSLYARVRAILQDSVTPWSAPFGFNMRWSAIPAPLQSYPGLVRWTPVEGATQYQVWWLFPDGNSKIFAVNSNVADEREWYTFHPGAAFTGQVKWRVRALRTVYGAAANGLPAVSYGPWSPVYTKKNTPFAVGSLQGLGTVSDTVSSAAAPKAHRLLPAFLFAGNRSIFGDTVELFRVYVFTDSDCINVVHKGSIVGSPAYAPRPFGALQLPTAAASVAARRASYDAPDGSQTGYSFDAEPVVPTESESAAAPFSPVGGEKVAGAKPAGGAEAPGGEAAPPPSFAAPKNVGAPIDLWDTDWPRGRYYWTVVPVGMKGSASAGVLAATALPNATAIQLSGGNFAPGDIITVGSETTVVVSQAGGTVTLGIALKNLHEAGTAVTKASGSVEYRDLELAQEACASGRRLAFGKTSEPVVTGSSAPYVSGLSPSGRLTSARSGKPSFYGSPLVAWAPALGAGAYQVQVSRTRYPFRAVGAPLLTYSTSLRLALAPGTWWYRVRGINYSVPTGAQPMSWSAPTALVVAKPTFRVVQPKRSGR